MSRLAAGLWVSAYLHRLGLEGIPAHIVRRGDATAGAVVVKTATLDGQARARQRGFDLATGQRCWLPLIDGAEAEVDARLAREAQIDPDLWIVEVEDRRGRDLLDQPEFSD